ncbi:MAG TPA: MBL fold metallo-hydrolase [Thermoplasmata archaeon]
MANKPSLKLSIGYDSEALRGFEAGWGFSAVLSVGGTNILFDCGWDGHVLRRNLARMGLGLADIRIVFLSHSHWDHTGGLPEVLQDARMLEGVDVILHEGFSRRLQSEISTRARVVEVKGPEEIAPGIWSTGVLGKDVKEQALVAATGSGAVVLTGCAHPGIRCILDRASELCRPTSIVGGFHAAQTAEFPSQLERIVACHCTEMKGELLKAFGSRASVGRVGASYEFVP